VWQFFSDEAYCQPKLPWDATQIGRFRSAIGEAGVDDLLKATIDTALSSKAIKPAEFERVIVDSTVQEHANACPVDSLLLEIALSGGEGDPCRWHRFCPALFPMIKTLA